MLPIRPFIKKIDIGIVRYDRRLSELIASIKRLEEVYERNIAVWRYGE